jgi:hypothetical protein
MTASFRTCLITLTTIGLLPGPSAKAQGRPPLFAGFSTNLALVDTHHSDFTHPLGLQLSTYFGWRLSERVADVTLLSLTVVGHQDVFYYPPCMAPGCSAPVAPPAITGLSFARGFRFSRAWQGRPFALAAAAGGVWLLQRPAGARALSPMLAMQFQVGLISASPHLGLSLGGQRWFVNGMVPHWTLPLGVNVEIP